MASALTLMAENSRLESSKVLLAHLILSEVSRDWLARHALDRLSNVGVCSPRNVPLKNAHLHGITWAHSHTSFVSPYLDSKIARPWSNLQNSIRLFNPTLLHNRVNDRWILEEVLPVCFDGIEER